LGGPVKQLDTLVPGLNCGKRLKREESGGIGIERDRGV